MEGGFDGVSGSKWVVTKALFGLSSSRSATTVSRNRDRVQESSDLVRGSAQRDQRLGTDKLTRPAS